MKVNGEDFQTIWLDSTESIIHIIDQTKLPHHFTIKPLHSLDEVRHHRVFFSQGLQLLIFNGLLIA